MNSIMPSAVCSHYSTIGVAESRRFSIGTTWCCVTAFRPPACPWLGSTLTPGLRYAGWGWWISVRCPRRCTAGERTARYLRQGPDDDLWLGYMQGGYGQLEQGGRKAALAADSLVLYDAAQTFSFSLGGGDNHLVRIPRHLLSCRLPRD